MCAPGYCTPRAVQQPSPQGLQLQSQVPNRGEPQDWTAKTQPLMVAPGPSSSLVSAVTSPHSTATAGSTPMPKEGWHQGTPHHGARDAKRAQSLLGGAEACGRWAQASLVPLGLPSPSHRGSGLMGASLSPSPTMFQPEHRPCPCMVPAVSKEPGPGPRHPCRRWLGPAEGRAGTGELRGRVQSSPQEEAKECTGNFIQLEMDRTGSFSFGPAPGQRAHHHGGRCP